VQVDPDGVVFDLRLPRNWTLTTFKLGTLTGASELAQAQATAKARADVAQPAQTSPPVVILGPGRTGRKRGQGAENPELHERPARVKRSR